MKKGEVIFLTYNGGSINIGEVYIVTKVYESGTNIAVIKPVGGGESLKIQEGEYVTLKEGFKQYAREAANDALINAALRLRQSELCHAGDWQFIELEIIDPANIYLP